MPKWFVGGFVAGLALLVINEVTQNHLSEPLQKIMNIFDGEFGGGV